MVCCITMKDLIKLVEICKADLDSIGIKCGKVRNWTVNTRAKCQWGQCKKVGIGLSDISISAVLLNDDVDDREALNTIAHELIHTIPGCFSHKGKWKLIAEDICKKLPQYTIKRTAKPEEKGIVIQKKEPVYRYILRCTECGQEIKRQKLSKAVVNYKKYRCGKCGGKLERIL